MTSVPGDFSLLTVFTRPYGLMVALLLLLLTGCGAASATEGAQPLPTRMNLGATPACMSEASPERPAFEFLDAWQAGNYELMYSRLSMTSQQAIPFGAFVELYEAAHEEMTLERLSYRPNAMQPDPDNRSITTLDYTVTFETTVLGAFTDEHRQLHLVFEPAQCEWRVAWTAGAIFAEMENGGLLRMTPSVPRRASIYDRDGVVLADQEGRMVTVSIVPGQVADLPACLNTLSAALERPLDQVQGRVAAFRQDWLGEVGILEPDLYLAWESLLERDCNATFGSIPTRQYPSGDLAPHVLGAVGYLSEDELAAADAPGFTLDSILGRSGIESSADSHLRGQPGGLLEVALPSGQRLRLIAESRPQPSRSVYLTLDAELQRQTLDIFARWHEPYASTSAGGAVVVLDVNTGAVLAMVSYPSYDANLLAPFPPMGRANAAEILAELPDDIQLNRATQATYPAGSTMKIITSIAAADSGVYALDQRYTCRGVWEREGLVQLDWLPGGHGTIDLAGAVTRSCNPYFYEAGWAMNQQDPYLLPAYAVRLGLGDFTGLTDIGESPGFIGDPDWAQQTFGAWRTIDAVTMAIGQGFVEVTPLQMARVYAAVANGGTLYRPQLVESVRLLDDVSYTMQPDAMRDIDVDPAVLDVVREGMCDVTTTQAGTATFQFNYPEFETLQEIVGVCGKTGTASDQSPDPGPPHGWFIGYAPRENPEIVVVAIVENSDDGSAVAAPIVRDVMQYYFFGGE